MKITWLSRGIVVVALLAFSGCFSTFDDFPDTDIPAGKGLVVLSVAGVEPRVHDARTIFPDDMVDFVYKYRFSRTTYDSVEGEVDDSTPIYLEAGTWDLVVDAYAPDTNEERIVGSASREVTVVQDQPNNFMVTIVPGVGANGTLNWNVNVPADFTMGTFTVSKDYDDTPVVDLDAGVGSELDQIKSGSENLEPGSWLVLVVLEKDNGEEDGKVQIVHIYPGLPTTLDWDFAD